MFFPSSESLCSIKHDSANNLLNIVKSNNDRVLLNHHILSLDTCINSDLALVVKNKDKRIDDSVVEISNSRNINNNSRVSCYPNEVTFNESSMTSTKSKIPDILMINKYYGLIPQKFTISSRKTANSTPSSAGSSSRRSTKSNSTNKPRAKSSTHHHSHQNRLERKSVEESKGFRSENDSPEPIKMILVARRSSVGGCESPVEKSDPFGPVTKKMSVERYKKWKNCGGGKGRNMNMRSSSDIGQTLSLLDNGLPGGGFNSHAKNNNRASTAAEFPTNRRVIKIDLNRVSSWDDENYRITTTSSLEPTTTATRGVNKEPKVKVVVNPTAAATPESDLFRFESRSRNTSTASNNNTSSYSSCDYSFTSPCYSRSSSQGKSSPIYTSSRLDNNGSDTSCFVHNFNDCDSLITNGGQDEEQTTFMSSIIGTSGETNESSLQSMATVRDSSTFNSVGTSFDMSSSVRRESFSEGAQAKEELLPEMCTVDENDDNNGPSNNKLLLSNDLIDSGENGMKVCLDKKVASMQRCGKLSSRTLSFDDKSLDTLAHGSSEGGVSSSSRSDSSVKKRPTTALARFSSKTFTTPNGNNPPSKVIPWTQQKTAGGKALTLAERRAKFQRVPSIHSSSSLSMETGEEEAVSEVESTSHHCVRPPSSAFRESRKPLHVTQPPEIPTMIAQINPNADEDIQIEIEKVALMLRKMHSMKHFSMSLDSGIEAEMARASSAPEEIMAITKNAQSASTDSLAMFPEGGILNASGSESSVSSTESQSSEEEKQSSQPRSKLNSMSSAPPAKTGIGGDDGGSKPFKTKEKTIDPDCHIKRQCSLNNNSSASNQNSYSRNNNTKKMNVSSSPQPLSSNTISPTSATTSIAGNNNSNSTGTARRPPLRKAVSISCEQELLKTGGDHKRNEVNFNANDNGKSPRPKTATAVNSQRSNVSGTRSIHNNYQYRQNSISSGGESHQATVTTATGTNANSGSQGSRNRKILIKKALMEINQSSVNMRKKWGTLGRPRTAPSSDKSNNVAHHGGPIGSQQHPRKPLKASPFPISGNGKMGLSSSGKSASTGGGNANGEVMEAQNTVEKGNPTGQIQRSSSEAPTEAESPSSEQQQNNGEKPSKGRTAFRQCFSLDESALLGFSIKSVNGGRIPIFEKLESAESTESCPTSIMDDEISFLSSKKREQCLKVYEKMMKTGCTIKLETVFRGMLTPSEYRAFMRAAEKASQDLDEETTDQITGESLPEEVDASLEKESN